MRRRRLLAAPALILAVAAPAEAAALPVVASFTVLADIARDVGGEDVAVRSVLGPDQDAHHFQPRPSDAASLRGARVIVQHGLGFDRWIGRMREAAARDARLVTASEGIPTRRPAASHGHAHGAADPHLWQEARLVGAMARNIAAGLAAADPARAAAHRARAEATAARMDALDAWVRAEIATVPPERRRVITSHDAFGYFAAAYGVTFLAPQGVASQAEPSAAQVAALIRQIRERQVRAVFLDNVANPAVLDRIAREAGVAIGGRLYADALSGPDGPAPSVEAMFRHNVGLLVPAMRGG